MKSPRSASPAIGLLLIAAALVTTGCGKSATSTAPNSPGPAPSAALTPRAAEDVARHFGSTLSRQGGTSLSRIGATSLQAISRDGADRSRLAALAAHDEGSLSWSLAIKFYDAAGGEQPIYVEGSTARMTVRAHVRGHVVTSEHRASIGIARWLDVHGLLPSETEIEIDGVANDTAHCAFDATDGSASRRYDLLALGELTDVRQLKDESQNPYPLSGTAHWHVNIDAFESTAEGEREAHYEADVLVTFNGTRYPVIEISESYRYRLDLESGEIERLPA